VNGHVDRADRALVELKVRATASAKSTTITAWVDTAFTGELVVPRATIDLLGLSQSSVVGAGLADGKQVVLGTYSCVVEWFDEPRQIEVIESVVRATWYRITARLQATNRLSFADADNHLAGDCERFAGATRPNWR
jgi:predicted aspartyl protease